MGRQGSCRSSSLSVRAWCRENNVPVSSFYYWQ
ncbi:IS66 family insertion sequence element accessory protein TnpA [Phascolarctobacterium succinatutens]